MKLQTIKYIPVKKSAITSHRLKIPDSSDILMDHRALATTHSLNNLLSNQHDVDVL